MINSNLRKRIVWFINSEIERVLMNLKTGAVNKENALGSFNTLYQIASSTRDADSMVSLCEIIEKVRDSNHRTGLFHFTEYRKESYY
ncbi:hypothetical protein FHS16_003201 [Paenibacillus endophyticus]|uniref:Uncharacterized protein n=1 Tax=Paenibacillus endophyticus TaxID=1294268 RepID=A0A7W5C8V5_9BACL|nr:hypothetical protein [Paenibacillus endophyticus]MBB3153142.1 hypothetical protein [Paenibacillus endophyticus]